MGEGEGCGNRKSDVAFLGRKLKLHLLVYIYNRLILDCAEVGKLEDVVKLYFDSIIKSLIKTVRNDYDNKYNWSCINDILNDFFNHFFSF